MGGGNKSRKLMAFGQQGRCGTGNESVLLVLLCLNGFVFGKLHYGSFSCYGSEGDPCQSMTL